MSTPYDVNLREELVTAERCFWEAVSTNTVESFIRTFIPLTNKAEEACKTGSASQDVHRLFLRLVRQINLVCSELERLDQSVQAITLEATTAVRQDLGESKQFLQKNSEPNNSLSTGGAACRVHEISFAPYRQYFLGNLSHPYPSTRDKEKLLRFVPSHDSKQLATWFVNARRRSGWQALHRLHAGGSRVGMESILSALRSPLKASKVSKEAKEAVAKVKAYFSTGARDTVNEGIQDIVNGAHLHSSLSLRQRKNENPSDYSLGALQIGQGLRRFDNRISPDYRYPAISRVVSGTSDASNGSANSSPSLASSSCSSEASKLSKSSWDNIDDQFLSSFAEDIYAETFRYKSQDSPSNFVFSSRPNDYFTCLEIAP